MLIDDVTAILLISPNAKKLCDFYRTTLGIPLEEETHDGLSLHYGYSLGDVHFAIHNADGWPEPQTRTHRAQ
jgi:catechol 2,3-dioxygenase-like lactoylglutathione lyase family enzyme